MSSAVNLLSHYQSQEKAQFLHEALCSLPDASKKLFRAAIGFRAGFAFTLFDFLKA
jgi:hypothetical protein